LEPRLRSFICCPSCFPLYNDTSETPDLCHYRHALDVPPCKSNLFRLRTIR
ncbi:hypothetical protein EDD16DRAFT_1433494, partial [Pisolithus croceorrhizus]